MSDKKDVMLKKKLISAKKAIQKKFKQLHAYHVALDEHVSENFRPIIRPLKELVDIKKKETTTPTNVKEELKVEKDESQSTRKKRKRGSDTPTGQTTSSKSSRKLSFDSFDEDADDESTFTTPKPSPSSSTRKKVLGTPWVTNKYYSAQIVPNSKDMVLGNHKMNMDVISNKILIGNKVFQSTPGLLNLLLLSQPYDYTKEDLKVYKKILNYTNVHRNNFRPDGEIVRDKTNMKYLNIVSELFPEKEGGALNVLQNDFMIHDRNERKNFTYWDDPNELVERLKLLIASQSAGHTGHNNEILSIIEELREAKIIK